MSRLFAILSVVAAVFCFLPEAGAQIRIIPREKLDSIAHPALSRDSALLVLSRTEIDLGEMAEDAPEVFFTVKVTNTSSRDIKITQTLSSCSCLKAYFDRGMIGAGEEATLKASFNPRGHFGTHTYRIQVFTDDNSSPTSIVKIRVKVNE